MQPWRVRDIMTTDVITAGDDTPIAEIAGLLTGHRVSGIPIVDRDRRPLGVVSEDDLLAKVAATGTGGGRRWWWRRRGAKDAAAATSARDLMSGPAPTVAADEPLPAAARRMRARKVERLLVTGEAGELLGIATRADLLRPYARPDADIGRDVTEDVLRRTLWIGPAEVRATVDAGIVTLTGVVGRRTTSVIAERLVTDVPGVVAVDNEIRWRFDDVALGGSRVYRADSLSAAV